MSAIACEQMDMWVSPQKRAEPWRIAAETAASNPYFSEDQRVQRARYYNDMAEKIERGEA